MNLTILYLIAAMILTPLALEQFNKRTAGNNKVVNILKGLPAFTINLILCAVFGLLVCVIPFGAGFSLTNLVVYTALIFLGNQIVFQFAIKTLAKYRKAV